MSNKENSNAKIYKKIVDTDTGHYVSEVQEFNKPEDYEDAFKRYYPKEKR